MKTMEPDEKQKAIIRDACEMLRPFIAHAYTAQQFSELRDALQAFLRVRDYVPSYTSSMNFIGEGLWQDEQFAKVNDAEGARLGLTSAEVKERFLLFQDLPAAQSPDEVEAIRARVENWLSRFPSDSHANGFRSSVREKQDLLDLLADVGAPPPAANENPPAAERSLYPNPYSRGGPLHSGQMKEPVPDKHLVGV